MLLMHVSCNDNAVIAIFIHFLYKVPHFPFCPLPRTLKHLILCPFHQIDDSPYLAFWLSSLLFALDVRHRKGKGRKMRVFIPKKRR
jgi:hypothetical protein